MVRILCWLAIPVVALGAAIVAGNSLTQKVAELPHATVRVVASYPHDPNAFSQGLVIEGETLYEGTGKYGASALRKIDLKTGEILHEVPLDQRYFGEGITIFDGRIYQLTWKERICFLFDKATMKFLGTLQYAGEGWGLTSDDRYLYMSDGSSTIQVLDPKTMKVLRRIAVKESRRRIDKLNELEYVNGEIYANIWYEDMIVRIDPQSGQVLGWIDCSKVYPVYKRPDREHVMNGIAFDKQSGRLFITGKNWGKLYEIEVLH
jgi:glutaminyl-peptide cyclotransferase